MEKVSSQNKYINKEKEDSKYLKAIENYKYSQNSKVEKFKNLDEWLEKESYLYKKEVKDKRSRYIHLKRGTIIKVLTSKSGVGRVPLNNLIIFLPVMFSITASSILFNISLEHLTLFIISNLFFEYINLLLLIVVICEI